MLAMVPLDIHVSDTYFIVAHIHYVLFGGSLFTIFAGDLLLVPEDDRADVRRDASGKLHFWLTFIFFNVTFAPMHLIGVQGMPRRVSDYADQFATWNLIISISSFVLGLSSLIFLYNMIARWRSGPRAVANPWRALTIEWQVSSPPPIFNFDAIPSVVGGPYEYGVPGAVHAVFQDAAAAGARRRRGIGRRHGDRRAGAGGVADAHDPRRRQRDARRAQAARRVRARRPPKGPVRVVVCVPRKNPSHGNIIYADAVFDAAQVRVDLARGVLRELGIDAIGEVGDPDPYTADDGRGRRVPARPRSSSRPCPATAPGWLRRDLVERIEDAVDVPGRAPRHRPRRGDLAVRHRRSSSPTAPPTATR